MENAACGFEEKTTGCLVCVIPPGEEAIKDTVAEEVDAL